MFFDELILKFLFSLDAGFKVPRQIRIMNPYVLAEVKSIAVKFYREYYHDRNQRIVVFGINPGRFGAGVTGIPFTDPIRLENLGIKSTLEKRQETSSVFIYDMIRRYGGVKKFYSKYLVSAVCPLGFVKNGKNFNYYDDRNLESACRNFIIRSMVEQLDFPVSRKICICLGTGKNFSFLHSLNNEMKFFEEIIPLDHPRFIMQYRLKQKEKFIGNYLNALAKAEAMALAC